MSGQSAPVRKRITEILENETGGKSYKAHKYSLDSTDRPNPDWSKRNHPITFRQPGGSERWRYAI